ncbi:cob(I)yrinic acid a,c-diamide adenosyltransferase [Aeropyrum camini]|uniref:cob(I)yrinic acid a,c-diamide adenosyltransferase n=1 Tax=Aeropyrum camini TaxID=229980 RepID=UPI000A5C0A41|nr:cob(I)yrinic acid a,c-diamide adenosyltransferase [Aeropyrum camini]
MHLYTRSGDSGETWCFALGEGGKPVRVPKDHPLIEFLGTLDEANSLIGLARSFLSSKGLDARVNGDLKWIQRLLFNVGFTLSSREPKVAEEDLEKLERIADSYYGEPLRRFILPAGSPKVAALHTARTAVRRAERRLVSAVKSGITVDPLVLKIINRASDALFAMAIALARAEGGLEEV